ncbi:MAG: DUF2115 domain-containing protein [Methanoregula sp.]|nr:DUF2115 domain-containing protein [Methanoregula sp.]
MNVQSPFPYDAGDPSAVADKIRSDLVKLKSARTTGEPGTRISAVVLLYSLKDIQQMRHNFYEKIRNVTPEYRNRLYAKITEHLLGTWHTMRLMQQQGAFSEMNEPVPAVVNTYRDMVAALCNDTGTGDYTRLSFLKFLIAGFCMFVRHEPGHPAGTPFPGRDMVRLIDGVYYCPVREKANDVDAALCPFCPALQTPAIGYLQPPVNPSAHQKQEFIRNCHDFHNFNG